MKILLLCLLLTGCETYNANLELLKALKETSDSFKITSEQVAVTFSNLNVQLIKLNNLEERFQ